MKIKIYHDKTYNIYYDINDYVKIIKNNIWGKVINITGKPITAKLTIETISGIVEEYVWNVIPVTENGTDITKEQLFKIIPVNESIIIDNNDGKIIKFNDFN